MQIDQYFLRLTGKLVDVIFFSRPRIFGVGYVAYLMWIASFSMNIIRDYLLGFHPTICISSYRLTFSCLDSYIGGMLIFCLLIAWVGSAIIPSIEHTSSPIKSRKIYLKLHQTLRILIKDAIEFPNLSRRLFILGLLIVNVMIIAWIQLLFQHDPAILFLMVQISTGSNEFVLLIALIQVVSIALAIIFWNAVAVIFIHIMYVYYWFLNTLDGSIRGKIEGLDKLALSEFFMKVINNDRPGLYFTNIWQKFQSPVEDLMNIFKRIAIALILSIVLPYTADLLTGQASLSAGTISGTFIGLGLSIPTLYIIHTMIRYGQSLKRLMIVELEDIKVKGILQNDKRVEHIAQEIEYLIERFGYPLMSTRDLIESIIAFVSLIATILAVIIDVIIRT